MEQQRILSLLQQYKQIKQSLVLPLKIRLFFSTLETLINKHPPADVNKQQIVDAAFIHIFQKLADIERVTFVHWMICHVSRHFKSDTQQQPKSLLFVPQTDCTINNIQTSCKIEAVIYGLSTWSKAKFKLEKQERKVNIYTKQNNLMLNLEQYLVRRSKKHKYTIVFEAVSKRVSTDNSRVSVYFTESIFKELEGEILECVMQAHKKKIIQMSNIGERQMESKPKNNDQSLVFLSSEEITSFLKAKATAFQKLLPEHLHFRYIFQKKQPKFQLKISRSSKNNKILKLEFNSDLSAPDLKQTVIEAFKTKFKFRIESNLLEYYKKYQAVYQKYVFHGQVFDQINLREEGVSEKEEVYFSKGIDNVLTPNMLEFVLIQVTSLEQNSLCRVYVSLDVSKDTPELLLVNFMLEFHEMIERGQEEQAILEQTMQQQEFFSILRSNEEDDDFSIQLIKQGAVSARSNQGQFIPQKEVWLNKKITRICTEPLNLSQEELKQKIIKEQSMSKEWKRARDGGLVCIDLEMNADQKKMIKKIFANIGNNIFKIFRNGTGIINMCFPVTIFKKESHLQSIARNFSYAPLLFDPIQHSTDHLERFKSCVSFAISNCILGISIKKPFNPILGETFQCWIGGCPLYMEQISHHPPISSYYFKGRGYVITGSIEPKVAMSGLGLNGAKCWSEKPNYIQFDDGTKVCLIYSKMVIKNLIIGERQFHFTDKIFVYDMRNNYFAEVNFGPKKRGFLYNSNEPEDYVHGNIYRTTTAFLSKFKGKSYGIYPASEDIAKEICTIEGIWNEYIGFDGKQYLNFSKCFPYQMENEPNPLPSNSLYRSDINHILKNEMEQAQECKDRLEIIQRHDKRLRDAYKK